MRPLNKSERFLALLLGLAVFIVVNMAVVAHLLAWGRDSSARRTTLNEQKLVADAWLAQARLWGAREEWLKAARPAYTTEITPATLVRQLQDLSKAQNVRIADQSLLEGPVATGCRSFAIRLRMTGSLESMAAWLHALQSPSSFVECSAFVCRAGADAGEMEWEITLARYYSAPRT